MNNIKKTIYILPVKQDLHVHHDHPYIQKVKNQSVHPPTCEVSGRKVQENIRIFLNFI